MRPALCNHRYAMYMKEKDCIGLLNKYAVKALASQIRNAQNQPRPPKPYIIFDK